VSCEVDSPEGGKVTCHRGGERGGVSCEVDSLGGGRVTCHRGREEG